MTQQCFSLLTNCRLCKSTSLTDTIDMGTQIITSRFPVYGDYTTPTTPISLCMCQECGLLQLRQNITQSELYEHEYGYRSGINNMMRSHLKAYNDEICSKINLHDNDVVLDIGSNDATMLHNYPKYLRRIGIDPTGVQMKQYYGDDIQLVPKYFTKENFNTSVFGNNKCKVVSSIAMFYDLPDPVLFAKDIYDILDDEGIWTCEQSYVLSMLLQNSIDTICHEHLEYYALHQIKEIADRANFKIIDIKFNACNGGSFRIYFAKRQSIIHNECIELINEVLATEAAYGINTVQVYDDFMKRCSLQVKRLCDFIDIVNKNKKEVWMYGASTKGNCLLQYANIGEDRIKYAVERNPNKFGKMTSTGIPIISEETMRKNSPAFLLVLPWHFKDEIIEREKDYLESGGQIIFPLPNFEIISAKPRMLITGSDGHIASYLLDLYKETNQYTLYGIGKIHTENIIKTHFDMTNNTMLEDYILTLKPDVIVHLAGISSSIKAFNDPIITLSTNGFITANLCDIIHRNKLPTKLFNASSSDVYKGRINYTVQENDINMHHLHPYSIAKIMGQSIVEFYRKTYNLPFSNGIIFTVESPRKSKDFLLNKVAQHAKTWKENNVLLHVGNLDSRRNIIHAKDVVRAIDIIIKQAHGDNYLICGEASYKVFDIVIDIYKKCGISLVRQDNILWNITSGEPVVKIGDNVKEIDQTIINIQGYPQKLINLGWTITNSYDDLLQDLIVS